MSTALTPEKLNDAYFPSFESFDEALSKRILELNHLSKETIAMPVAALYMLWHGIRKENLPEIRKYDVMDDHIYDPIAQKAYPVNKKAMSYIKNYLEMSLSTPYYVSSQYVLRTRVSGKVNESSIFRAVNYLNHPKDPFDRRVFQIMGIYESGLFLRVHQLESEGYKMPVYRRNKRLSPEGMAEYERLFERKFVGINPLTIYLGKYRSYINHFNK